MSDGPLSSFPGVCLLLSQPLKFSSCQVLPAIKIIRLIDFVFCHFPQRAPDKQPQKYSSPKSWYQRPPESNKQRKQNIPSELLTNIQRTSQIDLLYPRCRQGSVPNRKSFRPSKLPTRRSSTTDAIFEPFSFSFMRSLPDRTRNLKACQNSAGGRRRTMIRSSFPQHKNAIWMLRIRDSTSIFLHRRQAGYIVQTDTSRALLGANGVLL